MEDIQLITYIIFGVLYVIYKVMQKKKEPKQEANENRPGQERRKQPSMTFEEMLREFTNEPPPPTTYTEEKPLRRPVQPKAEPVKVPRKQTEYFSYETHYDQEALKKYHDSVQAGSRVERIDDKVNFDDIEVGKVQLTEDDSEKAKLINNEYLNAFRTKDGAKKAFIYSEIFNRKYT